MKEFVRGAVKRSYGTTERTNADTQITWKGTTMTNPKIPNDHYPCPIESCEYHDEDPGMTYAHILVEHEVIDRD